MIDLLQEKTNKALVSMTLPISIGMLSTFLFQIIDTYFVGQLGAEALAALSFSSTIYFLLVGLFMGLSVGVSIMIAEAMGTQNIEKARQTTWAALLICLLLSVLCSFLGIFFIETIFSFLGAEAILLPLIKAYTIPLLMGIPLLTMGIMGGGILRSSGNVSKPELLMGIAGIINLFFDYALIFGTWGFPEMGIEGAAYATVLSWVFVLFGMLFLLIKDKLLVWVNKSNDSIITIVKEIFLLGGPTISTQIISPLTLMYLTFLLANESSMAVAAFGVAGRIETLLMIGILGVSTAITPFIAQNSGAGKQNRVDEAIVFGGRASTYLGLLVAFFLFLFIKPIATIFSDNEIVIANTCNYFYIISLSYVLYGLYLITTSIFNGMQLPLNSLKISLVKAIFFTVPLTLIGTYWGSNGIFIGLMISNLLAGFYAAYEMKKAFKKTNSALGNSNPLFDYISDFKQLIGRK